MSGALVVLTGAAGGVGQKTAQLLHRTGYRVVMLDNQEDVVSVARSLRGGDEVAFPSALVVDVTDEGAVREAVGAIIRDAGVPDIWINNAGLGRWGPFDASIPGSERDEMEVNYHGSVACIRAVLPHWQTRGRGHLVQITSSAALFHGPWMASYSASKAAISFFLRALRVELSGSGITITEVVPNIIRTPMSAGANSRHIPRIAAIRGELRPDDVAEAILRALTRRPREVRLPWVMTPFHIAASLSPRFVDWLFSWGPRGGSRMSESLD